MVRALCNSVMEFVDFDIYHLMATLRMLYSVILTNHFKVEEIDMSVSRKLQEHKNANLDVYRHLYLPSKGTICNVVPSDFDLLFSR